MTNPAFALRCKIIVVCRRTGLNIQRIPGQNKLYYQKGHLQVLMSMALVLYDACADYQSKEMHTYKNNSLTNIILNEITMTFSFKDIIRMYEVVLTDYNSVLI